MTTADSDAFSLPVACERFPHLIFSLAGPQDVEELSEFIMTEFFHRFPLKYVLDVEEEIRPWIGQYIEHVASKNYTIILRDTQNGNRIACASINDIDSKDRPAEDISLVSFTDSTKRPGWQKICDLLDELHVGVDLGDGPILSIDLLAVGEFYVNRGLSSHCVKLAVQLARSRGIEVIKVEAVNEFVAMTLAKHGFELVKEIDYNQFEVDGVKPFEAKGVHTKARFFIMKIHT